ncbi:hypothetical protein EYF80_047424 [Liparis tanakae]|uniref:Uncharacterized protein n=1 Tax=Liparis tanakae TaxID=230148 RepID=A0A4Z2FN07_9TELE|nr:hypothetical protein EYF80_047424 [Liparis tanakae]
MFRHRLVQRREDEEHKDPSVKKTCPRLSEQVLGNVTQRYATLCSSGGKVFRIEGLISKDGISQTDD